LDFTKLIPLVLPREAIHLPCTFTSNNQGSNERNDFSIEASNTTASNFLHREPCHVFSDATVLLNANDRPATKEMIKIVQQIACDTYQYEDWDDSIVEIVKQELAKVGGSRRFLISPTTKGVVPPSGVDDHRNGLWFDATDDELREYIQKIFLETVVLDES
jgi:hypothetical protein